MKIGARVAAVLLVAATLALTGAAVVAAHAIRLSTEPAENAALTVGPARVSATFSEQLEPAFAAMTVVGPDGHLWSSGEPQVQGAVVSVTVSPLGPVGKYTVNYRVTSADGHVVSGAWSFTLTQPGTGTPGPAPVTTADDGWSVWPLVVAATVLIAGGAWWAVRRRP